MTGYVALFRAVSLGDTEKLPMNFLAEMCAAAGSSYVQTYIANGNVVFQSDESEDQIRSDIERRLADYKDREIIVVLRSASDLTDVLFRNPFPMADRNDVIAIFTDAPLPSDPYRGVTGVKNEKIRLGSRELFVFYPDGMAGSQLTLPLHIDGTLRNINTIIKLAEMASNIL